MPDLISWSNTLSVGVGSVDDQHKQLVAMVNEMNAAIGAGQASDKIGQILSRLINYTASHFKHEESLMQTHGYPNFAKHKQEHDDLVKKVLDLQKKFESGQARMNIEVMVFLKTWLTKHIQGTDKAMGAFIASKKVA